MSDAIMTQPIPGRPRPAADVSVEFDYTPVPAIVPIALVTSVIGLLALISLFGIAVALLALLLGLAAWRTVSVSEGQYGGKKLALFSTLLAAFSFVSGIALQVQTYRTEIPDGAVRLSFNYDISKPGVAYARDEAGQTGIVIPDDIKKLDGKSVFIKGFMYPEQRQVGLENFLLVKDSGDCCFGGQPAIQDIIGVRFDKADGLTANYYNQKLVAVAGTFHIREGFTGGSLEPVYEIEATHFTKAKSSF